MNQTEFIDQLSYNEKIALILHLVARKDVISIDLISIRNSENHTVDIICQGANRALQLTFSDTKAELFVNFQGTTDCSSALHQYMLERENGASYARRLYENKINAAENEYQKNLEIHNNRQTTLK